MDAHRLIQGLARDGASLELKTIDLCFLAALHLRSEYAGVAAFEDATLVDLFLQVCEVVEGGENVQLRATYAIQRLRDQRLLVRVDGADLARPGEFTLTRLAIALVEFYLADEALTVESLSLLTGALQAKLAEVSQVARLATRPEDWRRVIGDLRVTVGDLVGGIERRQRGLDLQQARVRAEIGALLQADWSGAIDRCQALLDTTARTLTELNEVLLRDAHLLQTRLQDILGFTQDAATVLPLPLGDQKSEAQSGIWTLAREAEEAAGRVMDQVDRIGAWGRGRQRAWSEFFQYVHRYLRDVVRLDPDRALSQRLRDQLGTFATRPFALVVAHAPSIRLLRPPVVAAIRPPVERPHALREVAPETVSPEDERLALEARVRALLAEGEGTLAGITERILNEIEPLDAGTESPGGFVTAGRIAAIVAKVARVGGPRERTWQAIAGGIVLEDGPIEVRS